MNKPDSRKLVWVVWVDAVSDSSRIHSDEVSEIRLSKNTNLGWIIHENDKRIVLAHGFTNGDEIDYFAIPKGDIISIEPTGRWYSKARATRK